MFILESRVAFSKISIYSGSHVNYKCCVASVGVLQCSAQSAHVIQRIWIKYRHVMFHHDDVSIDDTNFYVHSSANIIILCLFLLIKSF